MNSEQLVQSIQTVEKKLRALDDEMVILLKAVKQTQQDPMLAIFMKAVEEAARVKVQHQEIRQVKAKPPKKRGTPREFSDSQKLLVLSDYDQAIASGIRGAGKKALSRHQIYSTAYVSIWRKELAKKTAPDGVGLGHSNLPVNF